jgi:hypothetical protein
VGHLTPIGLERPRATTRRASADGSLCRDAQSTGTESGNYPHCEDKDDLAQCKRLSIPGAKNGPIHVFHVASRSLVHKRSRLVRRRNAYCLACYDA